MSNSTRRAFLTAGAGALAWLGLSGCGNGMRQRQAPAAGGDAGRVPGGGAADAANQPAVVLEPTPECQETEDNIEGPYYRDGAPARSALAESGMKGTPLTVSGRVFGIDGASCALLAGAVLDVWQADDGGHYDNDGSSGRVKANRWILRGKMKADAQGSYQLKTIVPGRYLNGAEYRPAHIHVKLAADGFVPLTTQLYFPDDPYNDTDPFIKQALIMKVEQGSGGVLAATFDFVLPER